MAIGDLGLVEDQRDRVSGFGQPGQDLTSARISRANGSMTVSQHTKSLARNREIH